MTAPDSMWQSRTRRNLGAKTETLYRGKVLDPPLNLAVWFDDDVLKPIQRVALIGRLGVGLRIAIQLQRESTIPERDQVLRDLQGYSQVLQILTLAEEFCIVGAAQRTHRCSFLSNPKWEKSFQRVDPAVPCAGTAKLFRMYRNRREFR
jgi:hypothetical protein